MPQLDIVYIFMNYMWTWFTLMMLTWKIRTTILHNGPVIVHTEDTKTKLTFTLPWT